MQLLVLKWLHVAIFKCGLQQWTVDFMIEETDRWSTTTLFASSLSAVDSKQYNQGQCRSRNKAYEEWIKWGLLSGKNQRMSTDWRQWNMIRKKTSIRARDHNIFSSSWLYDWADRPQVTELVKIVTIDLKRCIDTMR